MYLKLTIFYRQDLECVFYIKHTYEKVGSKLVISGPPVHDLSPSENKNAHKRDTDLEKPDPSL